MKKYTTYKSSGVEWIGDIPEHWGMNKVKRNTYVKGRIGWKGLRSEDFIDEGPFLITGTDFVKNGDINWDKMYHVSQERYDEDPFIQVNEGDILITKDGSIGKIVFVKELKGQTCLNSGIFISRPLSREYESRYFYWVLISEVFSVFVDYNSGGSTIQHLYQNVFDNFNFPIPPILEQQRIVQFLDEKTEIIDKLISTKQRKIDLLNHQRTSLINQCITKGLDPNVKFKGSGLEWINEVPEHWDFSKLKYNGYFFSGYSFDSGDFISEGEVRVIKISNIQNNGVSWEDLSLVPLNYYDIYEKFRVFRGDLVFVLTRPIVSTGIKICFYNEDFPTLLNQRNSVFRTNENSLQKKFLYYLVRTSYFFEEFKLQLKETNQPNISTDQISNIKIFLPIISEQQQIVEYLDTRTKEIDDLISLEQRKIDVLKDYRKSLISEVITGKIDVRTNLN